MRRTIAAAIGGLAWVLVGVGTASAQDWIAQGSPAEGWTGATACVPGRDGHITALCLSLGCTTGQGPGATLSVSEAALPPQVYATITVGGEVAGVLDFRLDASGITYGAPLDEQDRIVERLRTGNAAEVQLDFQGGQIVHPLSLSGSGTAIDAALAVCPVAGRPDDPPDPGEASENPAADAILEVETDCDGRVTVEPGFVRQADVDGDGLNDAVLDWGGLRCDGSAFLYCGSGGCRQSVWLADREAGYRLLVQDLIELVELPRSGELLLLRWRRLRPVGGRALRSPLRRERGDPAPTRLTPHP